MTTYVGKFFSAVSSALDLNAATLTGAMDVIVVRRADGTLHSTPFHVRFGKLRLLRSREKLVSVQLDGEPTSLQLTLGSAGEAYFVMETDVPPSQSEMPSPVMSPTKMDSFGDRMGRDTGSADAVGALGTAQTSNIAHDSLSGQEAGAFDCKELVTLDLSAHEIAEGHGNDPISSRRSWEPPILSLAPSKPQKMSEHDPVTSAEECEEIGRALENEDQELQQIYSKRAMDALDLHSGYERPEPSLQALQHQRTGSNSDIHAALYYAIQGEPLPASTASRQDKEGRSLTTSTSFVQDLCQQRQIVHGRSDRNDDSAKGLYESPAESEKNLPRTPPLTPPHRRRLQRRYSVALELSEAFQNDGVSDFQSTGELSDPRSGVVTKEANSGEAVADLLSSDRNCGDDDEEAGLLPMSECRHLLSEDMTEEMVWTIFEENRVSYAQFALDPYNMLFRNPNVLFRVQDRLLDWKVAAPMIVSMACFNAPLDIDRLELSVRSHQKRELEMREAKKQEKKKSTFSWFGLRGSSVAQHEDGEGDATYLEPLLQEAGEAMPKISSSASPSLLRSPSSGRGSSKTLRVSQAAYGSKLLGEENLVRKQDQSSGDMGDKELVKAHDSSVARASRVPAPKLYKSATADGDELDLRDRKEEREQEASLPLKAMSIDVSSVQVKPAVSFEVQPTSRSSTNVYMKKSLTPTSEQLAQLNLKLGANVISFTVLYNGQTVSSRIFLWEEHDIICISDVDGTITRSDVLGHLLPRVGRDWSHIGVARLFTYISERGFRMMYLTSRPIGQAGSTRLYLSSIVQEGGYRIPDGPVIMSPDRLVASFTREVIYRRPDEFKIEALRQVRTLFPPTANPFFAGFGNRMTDEKSYRSVSIRPERIFTVNPKGDLEVLCSSFEISRTYTDLTSFLHDVFPDLTVELSPEARGEIQKLHNFNEVSFWGSSPDLDENDLDELLREAAEF
ncbi:Phosphatidate phosphatase PAH2 [Porphyridium purpureum]|uniref:phosphatidate phosphatase n=1 Tax=Porphyridium purpureum TaxID=35688 RepID=A0A5J4YUC7_PORPP|nr:Phosphatidate phosphatase PAH2 [Porphyridium purpureum]|eukprot:POR0749..scf227_4